jgi:beta-1,4-mannosyltransferase
MRVAVVVLGDIGRSPRMQYHALALAERGVAVDLVGGAGHEPFAPVRTHPAITLHPLGADAPVSDGAAFVVRALWRGLRQAAALSVRLLLRCPRPDAIVVQSPPALPTLAIARLIAWLRGARLVIDWHNLGFTMLAVRLGAAHPAVRLAGWSEGLCGRRADAHLCVSRALQADLAARWGIAAAVLYDRPARQFTPLPPERRERILDELWRRIAIPPGARPLLVISPTSWTADEDFALLLEALARCEELLRDGPAALRLLVLLTGTGPLRARYEPRLPRRAGAPVRAAALWLPADDYPSVLAAADLGLSLHRSASGLDLPMKIADMRGAGLPVCALDYGPCLREIVRPDENALLFSSAVELAAQLCGLLRGAAVDTAALARLRRTPAVTERWDDAWAAHAAPAVLGTDRRAGAAR